MPRLYYIGWMRTEAGEVPRVASRLSRSDRLGSLRVRLAINRMNYRVEPGLYAVGSPDRNSMVLATANFKLSFDTLRQELDGLDAWIMVLDTKGINVWCAAGKGTFGTSEIVRRIESSGLKKVVDHRKIVVPQLGAPGVAAHEVKKLSGFDVVYGPVRASDIPGFVEAGMRATREMRRVRFSFADRAKLVPAEVVVSLKYLVVAVVVFAVLAGLTRGGYSGSLVLGAGTRSALNLLLAYMTGTVLGLLLLPWLPGRAFSLKGFFLGLVLFAALFFGGLAGEGPVESAGWFFLSIAVCSFIIMNLTGSSTYTSLSGVKKEMRVAVPLQIVAATGGLSLWISGRFV